MPSLATLKVIADHLEVELVCAKLATPTIPIATARSAHPDRPAGNAAGNHALRRSCVRRTMSAPGRSNSRHAIKYLNATSLEQIGAGFRTTLAATLARHCRDGARSHTELWRSNRRRTGRHRRREWRRVSNRAWAEHGCASEIRFDRRTVLHGRNRGHSSGLCCFPGQLCHRIVAVCQSGVA